MFKSNWLNFYLLSFLHMAATILSQTTYPPIWVTNNYVRADNNLVIGNLTGNSSRPNHTFIFSSGFTTGIPNLGYGIKAYQGKFFLYFRQWLFWTIKVLSQQNIVDSHFILCYYSNTRGYQYLCLKCSLYSHWYNISSSFE